MKPMKSKPQKHNNTRPACVLIYKDKFGEIHHKEGDAFTPLFEFAMRNMKLQEVEEWCLCGILYDTQLTKDGILEGIAVPMAMSPGWNLFE